MGRSGVAIMVAVAAAAIASIPAVAAATLPPDDGGATDFVRRQAEVAVAEHFMAIDPTVTNVACAPPTDDRSGGQLLCYGSTAGGQVLTATATINDDGGIDVTATAGGSTAPTVPPTSAPSLLIGSYEGVGNGVVAVDPISGPTLVRVTHDGAGPFVVQPQQGGAAVGGPLVDTVGPGTARYLVGLGGTIAAFAVTADGNWTLAVSLPADASAITPDAPASGATPDVVSYDTGSQPVVVDYAGAGPIVVSAVTGSGTEVIVDEPGPFTGEVAAPAGPGFITVVAQGPWSLSFVTATTPTS